MASANSFPLIRGRTMRVTKMDNCCLPAWGDPEGSAVSDGFISVALTTNITDAEEILVTNANGETCARDPGCSTFNGYTVDLQFCNVEPCMLSLLTGQPPAVDGAGNTIGFKMNTNVSICDVAFGLEVWMNVPGDACAGTGRTYGYLLIPCLQGGIIGDFTVENAAINFTVTGAITKDGNGWNRGAYSDSLLDVTLDPNDHLQVTYVTVPPPTAFEGCTGLPTAAPTALGGATTKAKAKAAAAAGPASSSS